MTQVIIRPDGTANAGTVTGAASTHAALSDQLNSSWVTSTGAGTIIGVVTMSTVTIPALAQIRFIQPWATVSGDTNYVAYYLRNAAGQYKTINTANYSGNPGIPFNTYGSGESTNFAGLPWTQADIDSLYMQADSASNPAQKVYELWAVIEYNEVPVVSAVTVSPLTTSRPTVNWTYTDPEGNLQERERIKVFSAAQYGIGGFNPETSPSTWDSGEIFSATPTAVVGADLQNGVTYKAYVKAADTGSSGRYSAWALSAAFTIALSPPPTPTLVITMQPTSARVQLAATHGTYADAAQRFIIQRSIDAGATWTTVRGANETLPTSGSTLTMWDYEAPRGIPLHYRTQTVADPAGGRVTSAWSTEATGTLATTGWWLKDPAAPGRNMQLHVEEFPFRQKEPQTVYEPLGRADSVVVGDGVKGIEGVMTLWAKTKGEYDALRLLLSAARPLRFEDVLGRSWYIKIGASHDYDLIRAAPAAGETTPIRFFHRVTLPFVEVAAPTGQTVAAGSPQESTYWAGTGGSMPTYVASVAGGISAATTQAVTRPTGTAAGDRLFLMWHADPVSSGTAPTITGWTKLSGYDVVSASVETVLYTRIADLTAADEPTVNAGTTAGGWYGGWVMTAIRGAATISVPVTKTTHSNSSPMVGPVVTTTAPNTLILHMGIVGNTTTVSAPTGGVIDRFRQSGIQYHGVGVATESKVTAGAGVAASWVISPTNAWTAYALAVTA